MRIRKRYHRRLNKALFVLYQTVNELDYFIQAAPVSSHEDTIARVEWLKKRVGESIILVTLDKEVIDESMIEGHPWPQ